MSQHTASSTRMTECGAEIDHSKTFETSLAEIRRWIRALPLTDQRATIRKTTRALQSLNRCELSIEARTHALALFTPLINTLLKRVAHHCAKSQQPFTPQRRAHFNSVQVMLKEITRGYQIIVRESPLPSPLQSQAGSTRHNARRIPVGSATHHLCNALYQAIEHLAQRLLHSYLRYTTRPAAVWSEIHRLYYIAETYNIPATPFHLGFGHSQPQKPVSIEHAYKRILLFSLADPYHLMPDEMSRAYQSLRSWASQCKVIRSDSPEKLQGRFYIDLESDLPPTHHTLNQHDLELPSLRLLDITEILPSEKYQRALDRRLAHALIVRPERLTKRSEKQGTVMLANGLSACHHYIGNENRGHAPHRENSTATLLEHPNPIEVKIASRNHHHITFSAQQKNASLGGLALHHHNLRQHLPTGALVTYRLAAGAARNSWHVGTVKWSCHDLKKGHELGIKCLAEDGAAVVTRAMRAEGEQTAPYQPALLTPNINPHTHPTTLITPMNQYCVGDSLQIHAEQSLFHVELIQLIETTWAYAHYRYRIIASSAH